jgi:hypothetical protein
VECEQDPACGTNGLSCQAISYCYTCCPQGDQACYQACEDNGSVAGLFQLWNLQDCMAQPCGQPCTPHWQCYECGEPTCRQAMANCGYNALGDDGCADMMTCMTNVPYPEPGSGDETICPSHPGVVGVDQCFWYADSNAAILYSEFSFCVADYCYQVCYAENDNDECSICVEQTCGQAYDECQDDY